MKDEKLGMKTFDHSIYKMVINKYTIEMTTKAKTR
jgi:hypothetical protein